MGPHPDSCTAANCLSTRSIPWRPQLQDAVLSAQKCAGSKKPGASGGSVKRALKHRAWQLHVCHLPASVPTVTWQGSTPVDSMSHPQKQHGPNFTEYLVMIISTPTFAERTDKFAPSRQFPHMPLPVPGSRARAIARPERPLVSLHEDERWLADPPNVRLGSFASVRVCPLSGAGSVGRLNLSAGVSNLTVLRGRS